MIKELIKIANKLDSVGMTYEADILDAIATKVAQQTMGDNPCNMTEDPGKKYITVPTGCNGRYDQNGRPEWALIEYSKKTPEQKEMDQWRLQKIQDFSDNLNQKLGDGNGTVDLSSDTSIGYQMFLGRVSGVEDNSLVIKAAEDAAAELNYNISFTGSSPALLNETGPSANDNRGSNNELWIQITAK